MFQVFTTGMQYVFRNVFAKDITTDNLLLETDFNLLQEDGSLILLEQ